MADGLRIIEVPLLNSRIDLRKSSGGRISVVLVDNTTGDQNWMSSEQAKTLGDVLHAAGVLAENGI